MHLLEQGQDSQPMESQFHLGYRHTDKNVAGTRVKTLLSYPKLRESIPPGQEHPTRAGASLQARSIPPGLCCIMQSLLGKKLAFPFFILQTRESLIKTRSPQQVSAM